MTQKTNFMDAVISVSNGAVNRHEVGQDVGSQVLEVLKSNFQSLDQYLVKAQKARNVTSGNFVNFKMRVEENGQKPRGHDDNSDFFSADIILETDDSKTNPTYGALPYAITVAGDKIYGQVKQHYNWTPALEKSLELKADSDPAQLADELMGHFLETLEQRTSNWQLKCFLADVLRAKEPAFEEPDRHIS